VPNLLKLKQNQLRLNRNVENNGWHGIEAQRKAAGIESELREKQLVLNQNSKKLVSIESKLQNKAKQSSSRGLY